VRKGEEQGCRFGSDSSAESVPEHGLAEMR